jgi:hypothetical protein
MVKLFNCLIVEVGFLPEGTHDIFALCVFLSLRSLVRHEACVKLNKNPVV